MNEVITTFEEDVKVSKNGVVTFKEWTSQPLRELNLFPVTDCSLLVRNGTCALGKTSQHSADDLSFPLNLCGCYLQINRAQVACRNGT